MGLVELVIKKIQNIHTPSPQSLVDINLEDFEEYKKFEPNEKGWKDGWKKHYKLLWLGLKLFEKEYGINMRYHGYDMDNQHDEGPHFECPKCRKDINYMHGSIRSKCSYDILPKSSNEREVVKTILENVMGEYSA